MERYRIGSDGCLYYVTFSIIEWLPVFVSEAACRVITNSLSYCYGQKGLRINAFVVMPTHLHAIVFPADLNAETLRQALVDFRKFTGRQLLEFCQDHMPHSFSETFIRHSGSDRARRFWQLTRHPIQLQTEAFWRQKFDYLHNNPCRKGLVLRPEHWRFSSAAYWSADSREIAEAAVREVALSLIDW